MGIIDDGGGESNLNPGGPRPVKPNQYNPIFESEIKAGQPVAIMTAARAPRSGIVPSSVLYAQATSTNSTYAIGVATRQGQLGLRGFMRFKGPLTLPAADWTALIDIGGALVQGVPYYVSTTPGKITQTAPDVGGTFVAPIGYALSPNSLFVLPSFPTPG